MPTRNRRRFVSQAIFYFLRQDYPAKELIVVDDGDDPVRDLIPDDDRVRYLRLDRRQPIGTKRNHAVNASSGELIAHWDDDDWVSSDRLSRQVAALGAADASVCGASDLLLYRPTAAAAWLASSPDAIGAPLAGGTLLYRRSAWAAHPFPPLDAGEEAPFLARFAPREIHAMPDASFYLGVLHEANALTRDLRAPGYHARPVHEALGRLIDDAEFYLDLRHGRAHRPRTSAALDTPTVSLVATFDVCTGYGSMSELLALGLAREGVQVYPIPLGVSPRGLSDDFRRLLARRQTVRRGSGGADADGPLLYFSPIEANVHRYRAGAQLFVNTMWESTRLPDPWVAALNDARAVVVPTRFVAESCRASGVAVPIEVVPEGVDPAVYHWIERPERAGLTTLIVGPVDHRKHVLIGIAAWKAAFADAPSARLVVKTAYGYHNYTPDDPRITYVDSREETRGIAHWYQQADVLLALGNEGFGLPLVEGMATGLPVIALSSEGQADVCREAGDLVLAIEPDHWRPYPWLGQTLGVQGVPGVADVAAKLRWVAEHRAEARALGRAASAWATTQRDAWRKAPAVLDVLERYGAPSRPLRRRDTFLVPSWQTPCGVAEYTARLVEALPAACAVAALADLRADLRGVSTLHVQHASPLFDDAQLTRQVQQARRAGLPVAVTEHIVVDRLQPWERDADALVALTVAGTARLRQKWPGKRVEHIPCGCPDWIPPRQRPGRRRRVIGAFGFLDRHKGFWSLLDVLRQLPGTELLLFGHARSPELAAEWAAASAGLPVRWIADYLPIEEIARRLADEADILTFWYDDVPFDSASSAAHVGLATGVPVLTSPTRWFHDLRSVTHQPGSLTVDSLAEGVADLLDDTARRDGLTEAARDYCHRHAWSRIADRHRSLWSELRRA